MEQAQLKKILDNLIATWENEVVEFKEPSADSFSTSDIGKYFSALSNEANLRGMEKAWLVFGVNDKTRQITNTNYRIEPGRLQSTSNQIAEGTEPSITFRNIHELHIAESRVILFEIPAAPRGMPIAWQGHYYARAGQSQVALGIDKQDEIRQQTLATDWSAKVVSEATFDDIDEAAIQKARDTFARKHSNRFSVEEMESWPLKTFLDRAKLTQNGQITRTTLLLLGKAESAYLLSPHPAQMTWKLDGPEHAYQHFGPPFFLTTTELYQKIRNIQLRLLPSGELLPHEISKYDQKIVLEALHNCIAHQDYVRNGRINVIEQPDKLIFENEGSFFEGTPNDYALGNKMPRRYRNSFLVEAMVGLNMIDKMGYGIHEMHRGQAKRYLPMPDYNLTEPNVVRMTIYGGVVDPAYSQLLMQKTDLPLVDILALDRVQKKLTIPDEAIQHLRRVRLIEGRKPNFHVSADIAAVTSNKADYIRMRSQDDAHYTKLIEDYLDKFKTASRNDIDKLLWSKLGDVLDESQKRRKIGNLLTGLRRAGIIQNKGVKAKPIWQLAERLQKEKSVKAKKDHP